VIDYARAAGRRQVLTYVGSWSSGPGHYAVSPANYPDGEASLKRVAGKLHNAGMELGIHINTPVIAKSDAYVSSVPDPRIVKGEPMALAEDVSADAVELPVMGQPILMRPIYLHDYADLMATWNGIVTQRTLTRPVVAGYAQAGDVSLDVQIDDELDYLFERAHDFDACIGIETHVAQLEANLQTPQILARFRDYERERFGEV